MRGSFEKQKKENDFICTNHNESYNSFCQNCAKNLCICCEINHKSHKIIYFGQIMPSINEVNDEFAKFKENIDNLKTIIEKMKEELNETLKNIVKYLYIYSDTIRQFKEKKRNFEIVNKVATMKDDFIIKTLKDIKTKSYSIEQKFSTIFSIKYTIDENPSIKNYNPSGSIPTFLEDDFKKFPEKKIKYDYYNKPNKNKGKNGNYFDDLHDDMVY